VLGGLVLVYIYSLIFGNFDLSKPISKEYTSAFYTQNIAYNPFGIGIFTTLFVVMNYIILRKGIIDGIEKSVKFLMPLLLLCLLVVVARNLTLPGAMDGVRFYLEPDFSKITPKLFIDVLGQVFFALSLGFGVMITLSSHLKKTENMVKTAVYTGILNTIIAVLAGFMIFPALFSAGLSPAAGPSLVFETLPVAFSHIQFGTFIAALFFTLLLIAALTTSLPIYQVIICVLEEKFKMTKNMAIHITLLGIFILGNLPCILTYGAWRDVQLVGNRNIFDSFDFVSGNILFVVTAFLCCVYVGWVMKKDAIAELSNDGHITTKWLWIWYYYVKFIVPVIIGIIFYFGIL
ncbi:MAG: sodium-dependent transporter, partial [Helicobacter sp.]|nr:sodium-dependent transporter [Helicobacter sp.]